MSIETVGSGLRGIMFVSINSTVMCPDYLDLVKREANKRCESLVFCLLDEPEMINQMHLWNLTEDRARNKVLDQCTALRLMFAAEKRSRTLVASFRQYKVDPEYIRVFETITLLYNNSGPFRRHCHNQVFRNLQPILRRKQITDKRKELVRDLSSYLLQEISLKLFIARHRKADVEFAPKPEMDLVEAIYSRRYSPLNEMMNGRLPYVIVRPGEIRNDRT